MASLRACVLAQAIALSPPATAHHCPGPSSNAWSLAIACCCGCTMLVRHGERRVHHGGPSGLKDRRFFVELASEHGAPEHSAVGGQPRLIASCWSAPNLPAQRWHRNPVLTTSEASANVRLAIKTPLRRRFLINPPEPILLMHVRVPTHRLAQAPACWASGYPAHCWVGCCRLCHGNVQLSRRTSDPRSTLRGASFAPTSVSQSPSPSA
jgi:hypothetical protein